MRCMAGVQYRRILHGHWVVDTGIFPRHVGSENSTTQVYTNEQCPSWHSIGASSVQGCRAAWYYTQGTSQHSWFCTQMIQIRQIGHVTCDNASNMDTMMNEFPRLIEESTGMPWNVKERRVWYLFIPVSFHISCADIDIKLPHSYCQFSHTSATTCPQSLQGIRPQEA